MDPQWKMLQLANLISKIDYTIENSKGCQLWSKSFSVNQRERLLNRGPAYGRLKVKYPDGTKKYYLAHRFMWMLHNDELEIEDGQHISHICHCSLCINPLHLSKEPQSVNNERQICKNLVPVRCIHHNGHPDCIF